MQNNFSKCREWVPRGTSQHKWRWLTTLLLILTLGIGQMWADDETITWSGSSLTGVSSTNITAGTAIGVDGDTYAAGDLSIASSKIVTPTKKHTNDSYYEDFSAAAQQVEGGVSATGTARAEFPFTVAEGYTFTISDIGYKMEQGSGGGPAVHAFIVQGSTATWLNYTTPSTIALTGKSITLSAGSAKLVFVLGVTGNFTNGRYFKFSNISIKGAVAAASGGGGSDPVAVTGISLAPASATIKVGKTVTLVPTITPSNATDKAVTWAVTSGSTYASVTDAGVVTGLAAGTATVRATAHDGSGVTQDVTVTVSEATCPSSGELFSMTVTSSSTVRPPRATDSSHPGWLALDDYATISGSGEAKAGNIATGSDKGGISSTAVNLDGNDGVFWVALDCELQAGDIIEANVTGNSVYLTPNCSRASGITINTGTNSKYTIVKDDKLDGESNIYFWKGGGNAKIASLTITRPVMRTISFDSNGGSAVTAIKVEDGKPATKPADPTWAHHRFDGWYDGSDPYDWSETVGGDLTLTAHWTQLYTVTYAAGDGTATGDAPTQADLAAGEKFNVAANTFAVAGKDFVKWNDGTSDYNPGQEYTMGSANVTLTAQWKAASAKYTVHYMDEDGTTPLAADELVEVTQKPAGLAEDPTKPLYTFAAWQLSGVDIALDAASWTSVAANTEVTLTARWAKAYAEDIDFEAFIDANTTSGNWQNYLSTNHYAISNTADVSLDDQGSSKPADKGLKMKNHSGAYVSFNVQDGKLVLVKMGRVNCMAASVDGGANYTALDGAASSQGASVVNYLYNAAEAEYRLKTTDNAYNIIQSITIQAPYTVTFNANGGEDVASMNGTPSVILPSATKGTDSFLGWFDAAVGGNKIGEAGESYIPSASIELFAHWEAISTDARLASITFSSNAGTLSPTFDPEVTTYTYTMPYKTAAIPTITGATSVNANAQDPIIGDAAAAWGDAQTIKGVAESGDKKTYTITMKVAPKDGVSIIETKVTSQNNHGPVGGLIGGDAAVKNASTFKLNTGNYVGVTLAGSNKFQAGDVVAINVTNAENATGFTLYTTNDADSALIVDTRASAVVSTGIHYVTIPATYADGVTPYEGTSSIYLLRADNTTTGNMNPRVDSIAVLRAMNPVLKSITFDGTKINVTSTTVSETLPYGTDLAVVTPEIVWNGAGTAVVTTNSGNWAWGENTYVLTDKDGDATTYTITLTEAEHYVAQIGTTGYASLTAAVAAANANDVVKLLDNVDVTADGLTIAKNMTLDLNGFNIKAGEQLTNDINVPAGVKLTLVDNSANAEGKIYTEEAYTGSVNGYGVIRVAGEFLMQSGNIYAVIESDPANLGQFAVVVAPAGKVTVEGGQIKAGWYAISNNGNNTGSTIIVSGGELISTADFAIYNPAKESTVTVSGGVVYGAAGGIAMNRGELTVTGGTITSKDQGTTGTWGDGTGGLSNAAISASGKYESVEVEISGGTIVAEGTAVMITNGTTNPVEVAISGGQFSHVVPAEYCADGFAPVTTKNANDKYEVEDKRIYIFNGTTSSATMATSPSGAIAWEIVGSTMGAADKSGTYDEVSYVKALQSTNSSTSKHFRIDVALNNNAKIEVIGMSNSNSGDSKIRHAWLTNSTDKGEIANAIASLESDGYNPEYFATDWLEEGSYYLHSDNTVNIFLIRVTPKAVDPKCEQPTITTQPATNLTFGAGDMTATVVAEVSDEGTLTYQWYNAANDEAVVGQTTATLTTADEGTYYVIVTNTKVSHRDNSIKSDEAQLAHRVMNDATLSALSVSAGTLAPAFDPAVENYSVNLAMGTTVVPTLTATATMNGYANVVKNEATEFVNYEAVSTVVVTSEDLSVTKTYTVHYYVAHQITTLVDVTENTIWDWTTITARADGSDIDEIGSDDKKHGPRVATADGLILANYVIGGDNWDKIEGNNTAYVIRNTANRFYQGASLHFHSTKAGYLTINARNDGSTMNLKVANIDLGKMTSSFKDYVVYVPAGDVVIENVPATAGKPMRVAKITFTVDETPDYTRNVTNNIGTLCVDHNVVAGGALGATFYQIASRNELYNDKIDFEEVMPGEELKAGQPYIFKSTTGKIELYYGENEADAPVAVRGMIGSFVDAHVDITSENMSNILYIANNRLWNCEDMVGSYLDVVANRAYIVMSDVPTYADYQAAQTSNPAPRRRVTLGKDAEQTATGLENLVGGEQAQKILINGQMYILRGEKLYDATGRLVK